MVEEVTIALIGVIITGIGAGIAVFFNLRATRQNTKSHYYQIIKDLDRRFHEIEDIPITDPSKYFMHVLNYVLFMHELINKKIIPKNMILPEHRRSFSIAYWCLQNIVKKDLKKKSDSFLNFCKQNNIQEEKPTLTRLSRAKIITEDMKSILFSSDENKDADIYRCPVCTDMFGTKEEFAKHKKEVKCKPRSD